MSSGGANRPTRADLYALGATLYELATGEPPFGSGDALRLIHDHLARVPEPPAARGRGVPVPLSEIIMHLLEKEPDNRYQTADGLLHDLERLRDGGPGAGVLRVGERDFPDRLLPPSRLVGRDVELAALQSSFEQALEGRCHGLLVSGAPGVGKTALIDQLRAVVARSDGWFVSGKFDRYRRDLDFNGGNQAFRALGRLLLAEPEDELSQLRERILGAVGANAGLLTAVIPEFAAVLAAPADPGDPLTAQTRVQRAAVAALRAVASPTRPVVMFIDDLQWAGRVSLDFVDLVLSEEPIDGLLLVCAYREDDMRETHPLAAALSRWRELTAVRHGPERRQARRPGGAHRGQAIRRHSCTASRGPRRRPGVRGRRCARRRGTAKHARSARRGRRPCHDRLQARSRHPRRRHGSAHRRFSTIRPDGAGTLNPFGLDRADSTAAGVAAG